MEQRLINANELEANMYHEAFETDTDMQKWDSGCWIRYKMFENQIKKLPTVEAIPIDKPFLKMKYKGYTVYKTEWLKEHIEMEYRVIKGISASKTEAIPIEWLRERASRMLDFGEGIERIIQEWQDEQSK